MELPAMVSEDLLQRNEELSKDDAFFIDLYEYYYKKGFFSILIFQICRLITIAFSISFSCFLVFFVKWGYIGTCVEQESCYDFTYYVVTSPFTFHDPAISAMMVLYIMIFSCYFLWCSFEAWKYVWRAKAMSYFYSRILKLSDEDILILSWDEIVRKVIDLHNSREYVVCISDTIDELDVVMRIMRKENFLIALINKNLLDLRVPWFLVPVIGEKLYLTSSLEWSISYCLFQDINGNRHSFIDAVDLQNRFFNMGIAHFVLLPFLLIYHFIDFFFQNAQLYHSSKNYLGPRQWTPLALWNFREFNELPHYFEDRINRSIKPANDYISQYSNHHIVLIAKMISFISGSFIAVLLLISFYSEGAIMYILWLDHNFVWYMGIFTAIFSASRSLIPDEMRKSEWKPPEELLAKTGSLTHYMPNHWIENCQYVKVRDEFSDLFEYRVKIFALELLSVVLTPLILCFSLPSSSKSIVDFFNYHRSDDSTVRGVCDYASFNFRRYGDEKFGSSSGIVDECHKPEGGKLEQSYFNFKRAYPNWKGNKEGEAMLSSMSEFFAKKEMEIEADLALQDEIKDSTASMFDQNYHLNTSTSRYGMGLLMKNPRKMNMSPSIRALDASFSGSVNADSSSTIDPLLKSVLMAANIDFDHDNYWHLRFQQEKFRERYRPRSVSRSKGLEGIDENNLGDSISSPFSRVSAEHSFGVGGVESV